MAKSSTKNLSSQQKNFARNEAQKIVNQVSVQDKGLTSRDRIVTRLVVARSGHTEERSIIKRTRPSQILRTQRRADAKLSESWTKAAANSNLRPAELYSTAEHLADAKNRNKRIAS